MQALTRPGLRLLSLDGGSGMRAIAQLELLRNIMHRIKCELYPQDLNKTLRPCDYFHMIGGIDTGGMIAIMFTALHMTVEEVMKEFKIISQQIFKNTQVDSTQRSLRLQKLLEGLMQRKRLPLNLKIQDAQGSHQCKGFAITTLEGNTQEKVLFRTYQHPNNTTLDATVIEAMMATCAFVPYFKPVSIGMSSEQRHHITGPFSCINPAREVMSEAYDSFLDPSSYYVVALVSLGAGHPGIIPAPKAHANNEWVNAIRSVLTDCEQTAGEIWRQLGRLGLYHRLSVLQGLERWWDDKLFDPEFVLAQATACCQKYPEIEEKISNCVKSLQSGLGIATLEQLSHSGGGIVAHKSLPAINPNFVMREEPWNKLMDAMTDGVSPSMQKVVVVSGKSGNGKTELCTNFAHHIGSNFKHVLPLDGSSAASLQADIVAHIRSIGLEYSQASLSEALAFLSDPGNQDWLILIDNADNEAYDLPDYIPNCEHGFVLITTRNQQLGSFASKQEWHIELGVMSSEEALSMLKHGKAISRSDEEQQSLSKIATELGYLPVALSQARAYMQENRCDASDYLQLFKASRGSLTQYHAQDQQKINAFTSFLVSFKRLPYKAKMFLYIISHYHFADFPMQAFSLAAQSQFKSEPYAFLARNGPDSGSIDRLKNIFFIVGRWTSSSQQEIIRALQSYSMVSFASGFKTDLLRIHPLFRDWVFDNIPAEDRAVSFAAATRILVCNRGTRWMQPYLVPHIMHIVSLTSMDKIHVNDAAALGRILREADQLKASNKVWKDVYKRIEEMQGGSGIGVADTALELACTCLDDPAKMKELQHQALTIYQTTLGDNHEKTHSAQDSLASTYEQMKGTEEGHLPTNQPSQTANTVEILVSSEQLDGPNKTAVVSEPTRTYPEGDAAVATLAATREEVAELTSDTSEISQHQITRSSVGKFGWPEITVKHSQGKDSDTELSWPALSALFILVYVFKTLSGV